MALIIAGTAVAHQSPLLPKWIHAKKFGKGYVYKKFNDGLVEDIGNFTISWDFDFNCFR